MPLMKHIIANSDIISLAISLDSGIVSISSISAQYLSFCHCW